MFSLSKFYILGVKSQYHYISFCNIILDCNDPRKSAVTVDISTRCSKMDLSTCKTNKFVRNRCQLSCGVCTGSKYYHFVVSRDIAQDIIFDTSYSISFLHFNFQALRLHLPDSPLLLLQRQLHVITIYFFMDINYNILFFKI